MNLHEFVWIYVNLYGFMPICVNLYKFSWIYTTVVWIYMNGEISCGSARRGSMRSAAVRSAVVRSAQCGSASGASGNVWQCAVNSVRAVRTAVCGISALGGIWKYTRLYAAVRPHCALRRGNAAVCSSTAMCGSAAVCGSACVRQYGRPSAAVCGSVRQCARQFVAVCATCIYIKLPTIYWYALKGAVGLSSIPCPSHINTNRSIQVINTNLSELIWIYVN
jgi:hypothetical protein